MSALPVHTRPPRTRRTRRTLTVLVAGFLVVLAGVSFGPSAAAASLPAGPYLVVGGDNGTMSFVNRTTGTNVAQVPIDGTAYPVAAGPGNRIAFSGSINGIAVVDPSTLTVTKTLAEPGQGETPYVTFALSGDRTTLVAPNRTGSVIDIFDTATLTLAKTLAISQGGNPALAVSSDGSLLYFAPDGSPVISVLDLTTGTVTGTITLPNQVVDLELAANGTLYALLQTDDRTQAFVAAVDTATGVAATPWPVGIGNPTGLAVVPGGPVYVAGFGSNGGTLVALDATFGTVAKSTLLAPSAFIGPPTVTPDGSTVYVAVLAQQQVLAVSIPSLAVTTITTPYYQNALALMSYAPPVNPGPGPSTTSSTTSSSSTSSSSTTSSSSSTTSSSSSSSPTTTTSTTSPPTSPSTSPSTSSSTTAAASPSSTTPPASAAAAPLAGTGSNAGTITAAAAVLLVLGLVLLLVGRRLSRSGTPPAAG